MDDRPPARDSVPAAPAKRISELATQLARLARHAPEALKRQIATLTIRQQAELALRLPAAERVQLMLHAPKPMRLVRTLPDADLYLTVREVGPADALPMLALASAGQIMHLLDLESWRRDRFDAERAGAWVALLCEAGEPTVRRFLRVIDDDLLALLVKTWMHVVQIEYEDGADKHGHGEGDAGTAAGFPTPDGYYRFSPVIAEQGPAMQAVLRCFAELQPERYRSILWASQWELQSELEERALHFRQSRLEEHGFPTWEEALSVYAAPSGSRVHPQPPVSTDEAIVVSRSPVMPEREGDVLAGLVDSLPAETREQVMHGIVSGANRLLVADQRDTGDPDAHREVLGKVAGYVSIALAARAAVESRSTAAMLAEVPVLELFREGYARATELARRATVLRDSGWAAAHPRALELLDPPVGPRVEALLDERPRYLDLRLDKDEPLGERRDFKTIEELQETQSAIEMAEVIGELFVDRLGLDPARFLEDRDAPGAAPPRFSTFLLTVLAWHAVRGDLRGEPLPAPVLSDFLRNVVSRRTAPPEAPARALEMLIRALAERFDMDARAVAVVQALGRSALERLRAECGSLDPGIPLDDRFVSCLLTEPTEPGLQ